MLGEEIEGKMRILGGVSFDLTKEKRSRRHRGEFSGAGGEGGSSLWGAPVKKFQRRRIR